MQARSLLLKATTLQPRLHSVAKPPCLRRCVHVVSKAAPQDPLPSDQEQPSTTTPPAQPVRGTLEQDAEATKSPVVEATNVLEPDAAQPPDGSLLPRMSDAVAQQAFTVYTALAATHMLQGVGFSLVAWQWPSLLLPAAATGPLGSTLLGCTAAASVMASGLMLHLWVTARAGELGTWRHQRINAALALYGAITCLSTAWAAAVSHPVLSGVLLSTSLGCTVACALVARSCWDHAPWLQWSVVPGDAAATANIVRFFLTRDMTTLAGLVCLAWLATCAAGAPGVLLDAASWGMNGAVVAMHQASGMHPFYPYATTAAAVGALDALRRDAAAGLLLSAFAAHTLLEAATHVRRLDLIPFIKTNLVHSLNDGSNPVLALVGPPRSRFALLQGVSLGAAGGLLAAFLLRAALLGVDLNQDAALMAPLHWSALLLVAYLLLTLWVVDWSFVLTGVQTVFDFFANIVSFITQTVVLRREWTQTHKL